MGTRDLPDTYTQSPRAACHLVFGLLQVFSQSDLTLKDFKMIEVCEFEALKRIASSKRQMQFLQVLSRSQQFIEWLQKETKGKCLHIMYVYISINSLVEVKFGTLLLCGMYISLKLQFLIRISVITYSLMKFSKPVANYVATGLPNCSPASFYNLQ